MTQLDQPQSRLDLASSSSSATASPAARSWGMTEESSQPAPVNVGDAERQVSVAAGAVLAALGLSRFSVPGLLVAGVGGALIARGVTGHCSVYGALGLDTSHAPGEN